MSVVSRMIDVYSLPRPVMNGNPVGFVPGPPQYAPFTQSPQMPCFNVSKNIRKKLFDVSYIHGQTGSVPLYTNQFGSEVPRLFSPMDTGMPTLKVPMLTGTNMGLDESYEYTPEFQQPIVFSEGIRPSIRPLRETDVQQPTGATFRPATMRKGFYRPQPFPTMSLPDDEIVRQVRNL